MEPNSGEKIGWPSVHLETILVPTDLRPDSKVALSFALALAQKFEANLVLLHVFAEPYSSDTEIGAGQVDYWMPREKKPSERLPVWKSYYVLSIPSAGAHSELVVRLNRS
jgi:nucleotide-binding universal stress UspA family protein